MWPTTPAINFHTLLHTTVRRLTIYGLTSPITISAPPLTLVPSQASGKKLAGGGPRIGRNNYQWVFLGCPGVEKGTYALRLSSIIGVPHISTGDLLRNELGSSGSTSSQLSEIVNQGKLVPDEVIIDLLSKQLAAGQLKGGTWFILGGFPKTVKLACLGRRICSECGGNFNIACIDIKPENGQPGMYMARLVPPPQCTSKLITRSDDTEEVAKERSSVYNMPVEEFYGRRG